MIATNRECSKILKQDLKKEFPNIKFSVRCDSYRIEVDYIDGPSLESVKKITGKYEQGHFNSMEDIYEYDNQREDLPQRDYVFVSRDISLEYGEEALDKFNSKFNLNCKPNIHDSYIFKVPVISSMQDIDWNLSWNRFINSYNF